MFPDSSDTRLLVLGRDPDKDLLSLLGGWFPDSQFSVESSDFSEWLGELWRHPPQGLVLFGESLDLRTVPALRAWLIDQPELPVLVFSGARGLVGLEELLDHPGIAVLPLPWTIDALRQVVGRSSVRPAGLGPTAALSAQVGQEDSSSGAITSADEPAHPDAFAEGFLDGLVERFRDPLASLSGYLQLLHSDSSSTPLLQPALAAARELDSALDSLQLASEAHQLRPSRISAQDIVVRSLKRAQEDGVQVHYAGRDPLVSLRLDTRLVEAALDTGRLLLQRFGGSGTLELNAIREVQQLRVGWLLRTGPSKRPAGAAVASPPFLELLLARFAQRVGAKLTIGREANVVRSIHLVWPEDALRAIQPA